MANRAAAALGAYLRFPVVEHSQYSLSAACNCFTVSCARRPNGSPEFH